MAFVIPTKTYEKPDSGQYHAVLADIVDLGLVTSTYQGQTKTFPAVRFVWILDRLGKDGKPLQVQQRFNVTSLHEKSNVYKTLKMILGAPPAQNLDIESLIGQTRLLWIQKETKADNKEFANIMGILPAQVSPATGQQIVVPIPADFIRDKFKPKTQPGPQGQPVQTFQQPPQQAPQQVPEAFASQGATVKF